MVPSPQSTTSDSGAREHPAKCEVLKITQQASSNLNEMLNTFQIVR
jgi:hypothetical protein